MFSYAKKQWALGRSIYGYKSWREKRRITLFVGRSYKNKKQLTELIEYFDTYAPLPNLLSRHEGIYEVINRVFLFKNSTAQQRLEAIKEHFDMLPQYFQAQAITEMYNPDVSHAITIWENEELNLKSELWFHTGQRKEGFLSLFLNYDGEWVYHINFRLGHGFNGEPCIWIGTIQGSPNGLEKAKKITKKMHSYRPKNFMFFLMRQLATNMGISSLYAISDEGFYTNSHLIRGNRSKKVQFDPFWEELGGAVCPEDSKYFRIPLAEERKTYETAKTHKRNMYRKRYEMLDQFIDEIANNSKAYVLSK
ncbi:VirK/YbjX family protein [Veillonella intestinalis]|uniref:VirK/YbjX family protein n=1 Tax=Veillonella intestinalis TaxID=2941341 RepID=UPI00203A80F9|nr:DUF535 family protein [Veillonella intestinalis]